MGDVINLRLAKKQQKRSQKETQAQENRIRFGRTKAEKTELNMRNAMQVTALEAKRLERSSSKGNEADPTPRKPDR